MFNRLMRQIHRWLGLTIGVVLAVMGLSGSLMAFDDEIMAALSPGITRVAVQERPPLSPDALLARFARQKPGAQPVLLTLNMTSGGAARLAYLPPRAPGHVEPEGERTYLDPYDGRILGPARGEAFFAVVEHLHRFLLLPGKGQVMGRLATGVAAMALLFFALSGLYLRWPRRKVNLRAWLTPDISKRGRALYLSLHTVIGTWLMLFYLLSALTGLGFSMWRGPALALLAGSRPSAPTVAAERGYSLDAAKRTLLARAPAPPTLVFINLPKPGEAIRVRYLTTRSPHFRALDELYLDPRNGAVLQENRFDRLTFGQQLMTGLVAVHRGKAFGLVGQVLVMLAAATLPLFLVTGYLMEFDRRRRKAGKRVGASQ